MEKDYEVECALDTLLRAKEVEADKELMKKVQKLAKEKSSKILSIADLKNKYKEVVAKENEDENEEEKSDQEDDQKSSVKIEIEIGQKDSLLTEEDKAALQIKKELDGKNKGKLGDLEYES